MNRTIIIILLFVVLVAVLIFGIAKYEGNASADGDDDPWGFQINSDSANLIITSSVKTIVTASGYEIDYKLQEDDYHPPITVILNCPIIIKRDGHVICVDGDKVFIAENADSCGFGRKEGE